MRIACACVQSIITIVVMNAVHLRSLDLNLLLALDALLAERNVTRAAFKMNVTQSAMSHSLARLREVLGDPLLVRSAGEMVTTPKAEELAPALRGAFEQIARALSPASPFVPATSTARFSIATGDYAELVLLPELVRRLSKEAPHVDLRVVPYEMTPDRLSSGAVDVAILPTEPQVTGASLFSTRLFDERFVCVMRTRHPLAKKTLTLARYLEASHALVAPRGEEGGYIDTALAKLGKQRRVALTVPHFLVAPHVIAASDLIITLAERVALSFADALGLVVRPLPHELGAPGFTMACVAHERSRADPAHKWFRELLVDVARRR